MSSLDFGSKWAITNFKQPPRPFVEYEVGIPWTENYESETEALSSIYFRMGSMQRVYSNSPYSLLSLLGDLGGIFEIMMISGMTITLWVVVDAYESSLLNHTYQVQGYKDDQSELFPNKRTHKARIKTVNKINKAEGKKLIRV